jgi:hypothetical protein
MDLRCRDGCGHLLARITVAVTSPSDNGCGHRDHVADAAKRRRGRRKLNETTALPLAASSCPLLPRAAAVSPRAATSRGLPQPRLSRSPASRASARCVASVAAAPPTACATSRSYLALNYKGRRPRVGEPSHALNGRADALWQAVRVLRWPQLVSRGEVEEVQLQDCSLLQQ